MNVNQFINIINKLRFSCSNPWFFFVIKIFFKFVAGTGRVHLTISWRSTGSVPVLRLSCGALGFCWLAPWLSTTFSPFGCFSASFDSWEARDVSTVFFSTWVPGSRGGLRLHSALPGASGSGLVSSVAAFLVTEPVRRMWVVSTFKKDLQGLERWLGS